MDTGSDFIKPEFLNIVFFQQKNLAIFPYIDLKHLHALEIYTAGYNVVDLESTALHNLKEIIEFEANNSYSQNPTLFFIYNVDRKNVKNLMDLNGIRCIINSNENISDLVNGSKFIFFNKKNNQFLNYEVEDSELKFEYHLISNSQNQEILQEEIHKIKITASRIFRELNQNDTLDLLPEILKDYERQYWESILQFTSRYYDINIPDITGVKFKPRKKAKDYSDEYELLVATNKPIGKEFVQLLHEYRSKKVNPSHLELQELYNPQKLFNYLRNHHWSGGIPQEFIEEWANMNISGYMLTESDKLDFELILNNVKGPSQVKCSPHKIPPLKIQEITHPSESIPSIHEESEEFRDWFYTKLDLIDDLIDKVKNNLQQSNGIKIHKISNLEIRNMLTSGDQIFNQFQNSANFDGSSVINNYSKGLETILNDKLSSCLRPLTELYLSKFKRKNTSPEFNYKFGDLMKKKSISLGKWVGIMRDRKIPYKDIELRDFYSCIEKNFDNQTIMIIQGACEFISQHREAHSKTSSMDKIVLIRPKAIGLINSVIDVLYDNLSEYSEIPSLSDFKQFKSWLLFKLSKIEHFLDIH